MADAFAILVDDITAGIVVRHERERGYRFYASEPRFYPIDGQVFRNPAARVLWRPPRHRRRLHPRCLGAH